MTASPPLKDLSGRRSMTDVGRVGEPTGLGSADGHSGQTSCPDPSGAIPRAAPWWAGDNDDFYQVGPHSSREDALGEALSYYGIDRDIHLLQAEIASWYPPSAASVIDMMIDNSDELFFDDACDGLVGTKEAVAEAEAELDALLAQWLNKWRSIFPTPTAFGWTGNREVVPALAAAARQSEDPTQIGAEAAGPQSGGEAVTPNLHRQGSSHDA